ncbi:hypothetical protein TSUD_263640 [Trifolium subterraneum]|uniref:Uncharacterized protein n=1 Tax=Trifolium subterraneum TaxID=3900 RepID=A0A2Z6N7D5_TRISU|nr:hypothetical protein TSUD_263640 [Trifolium subterraneum]
MSWQEQDRSNRLQILNILKYSFTSHEPLTNTILKSCSRNKDNPPNQSSSAVRVRPCTSDSNRTDTDIKVVQRSIVKLLGPNSFAGCVCNLYKSMENMDSTSVLLNPGIAPQFGCPNQPLNIPHIQPPPTTYYYGTGIPEEVYNPVLKSYVKKEVKIKGGVIYKTRGSIYDAKVLTELDPDPPTESIIPIHDLEGKVIRIGEVEALSRLLGASLTSKSTLTNDLGDFLNVPEQESTFEINKLLC